MGVLLAIISSLGTAFSNVMLKKSFKSFLPSVSFFIFGVCCLFIWAPVGLIMGVDWAHFWYVLVVGFLSAILGQLIYFYILSKGELSITATILASFSIYTIIFSMIFNGERLSPLALLFVSLAILGTIIVSLPKKFEKEEIKKTGYILLAVVGAIAIGASDTISKRAIDATSIGSFLFCTAIAQFIVSFLYLKVEKEPLSQFKVVFNKLQEYKFALVGSLVISISTLFLFLAFNYTLASIASPIVASYPVLTLILASVILKERLQKKDFVGIILVAVALVGIGFATA